MEIIPLLLGWLNNDLRGFDPREQSAPGRFPVLAWLIRSHAGTVLFDTGTCELEVARRRGRTNLEQEPHERLAAQLQSAGSSIAAIDVVILSHLHWDHAGGIGLFHPETVCVDPAELDFATRPAAGHERYFDPAPELDRSRINTPTALRLLAELGVALVPLPGHTPGSQGALIEHGSMRILLAGDTVPLLGNLVGDEPQPNGIVVDVQLARDTLKRILRIATDVLPSHDPLIAPLAGTDILPRLAELRRAWRTTRSNAIE